MINYVVKGESSKKRKFDLAEYAYEEISEMIYTNQLEPEEILYEKKLADILEISRTPIREAMNRLKNDGLIEMLPGRGSYVKSINVKDLDEIYEMRLCFELYFGKMYMNQITEFDIISVESVIAAYLAKLEAGETVNPLDMIKMDTMVHNLMLKKTENSRLKTFQELIDRQDLRYRMLAVEYYDQKKTTEEHLDIIRAIKAKDYDTYAELLEEHLQVAKNHIIEHFDLK